MRRDCSFVTDFVGNYRRNLNDNNWLKKTISAIRTHPVAKANTDVGSLCLLFPVLFCME